MVYKYTTLYLRRINLYITQVNIDATVITKITAMPIPSALESFFDTPKKGHNPRNFVNTKLLMRIAAMEIWTKRAISMFMRFPLIFSDGNN